MERIKGGFPPLVSTKKQDKKDKLEKGEMKSQFFAETMKKNVNIRELLSSNNTSLTLETESELKVVDEY